MSINLNLINAWLIWNVFFACIEFIPVWPSRCYLGIFFFINFEFFNFFIKFESLLVLNSILFVKFGKFFISFLFDEFP